MLLLETLARDLLSSTLVIGSSPATSTSQTILKALARAHGPATSILLDARCARRTWPHRQTSASLASGASLHVICALSHADARARLKLLKGLSVA